MDIDTAKRTRRANRSGTLYRRGSVWYTKMKVNGKWVCQSTGTSDRAAAEKILNRISKGSELTDEERLAAIKVRLEAKGPDPSFELAWENYIQAPENLGQSDRAQDTDEGRWRVLMRWLHGHNKPRCRINCRAAHPEIKKLSDLTQSIAKEFVQYAKATASPNTVNKYIRTFKRVWALNRAENNPWEDFRKLAEHPHLRRALSDSEVQHLITSAEGDLKKLFALGTFTGLRMSDCAHLKWNDIDSTGTTITVRPSKTQHSSGAPVAIPIHPALAKILGSQKKSGSLTPTLARLPEWQLSDLVCAHFKSCGFEAATKPKGFRRAVPSVGFHSLRSTFITNMANIGAPMAMVQAIVGHMSPEMSLHYYRANAEAARTRIAALPNFGIS